MVRALLWVYAIVVLLKGASEYESDAAFDLADSRSFFQRRNQSDAVLLLVGTAFRPIDEREADLFILNHHIAVIVSAEGQLSTAGFF